MSLEDAWLLQNRTEPKEQRCQASWHHFLIVIFSPAPVAACGAAGKTLAVPYEHDPAFHIRSSASPKHND